MLTVTLSCLTAGDLCGGRSTQQMLRAYSHLRARAHPIKAAEKGVATAAEATTERWHALQHLAHKLHSLEASKEQPAAADPDQPGPSSGAGPSTGQHLVSDIHHLTAFLTSLLAHSLPCVATGKAVQSVELAGCEQQG